MPISKLTYNMLLSHKTECFPLMQSLSNNTKFPIGGYHRKLLRVDLAKGTVQSDSIQTGILRSYLGGTGLGAYLLYTEVPAGISPLDPKNRLIFATGSLTGTLVPGSGTYTVMSKSPLTGLAASAQANGFFGARLKATGYDALVVEGCSTKPVYLYISPQGVELKSAAFLSEKGIFDTEHLLRARHGEKGFERRISVAAIGPAGEHCVRYAAIGSDGGHMVASGGLGAVMGSKNLKAIVVEGGGPVPIHPQSINDFKAAVQQWREEAAASGLGKTVHEKGTLGLFKPYHEKGWVPIKNLTTNQLPDEALEQLDWSYMRNELYEKIPRSCHACTFDHCHTVRIKKGLYKGVVGEEPEYEILAGFGPNWGIYDPGAITQLNRLNDNLGMDAKEVSFLISMLMEGYEKGDIDRDDLDGIELAWGDIEAVEQLLKKISRRDGAGDLLAEGVMRTAKELGGNLDDMAVYVKQGNAPHIHDPRTRWGTLFTQVISNTASQEGMDMTGRASPELGIPDPTRKPDAYLAEVQAKTGPKRQFEECLAVGERTINLLRMYNIREGHEMKHDAYSRRLGQCPEDGPGTGKSLDTSFDEVRAAYYKAMGWDEKGVPTSETLKRLGLDFLLGEQG